jgi:ubiquinone/menaquinone biosynthesis C-methylase UbiE
MVHGDITSLPFAQNMFDLLICYHVLEHIPDDRAAMRELKRVLVSTGLLLVQVPIQGEITDEDPLVVDPNERLRRFGQTDHVRQYGTDFGDRLTKTGFDATVDDFAAKLPRAIVTRFGLLPDELIYACRLNG